VDGATAFVKRRLAAVAADDQSDGMAFSGRLIRDAISAGALAAVVSGIPSTVHAVVTGEGPLTASLAAGSLLAPRETRTGRLLVAGAVAHVALSAGWAFVLAATLPRRHTIAAGAAAGLAIAALDLGGAGRWFPRIRTLRLAPQLADHIAFGAVAGAVIARRRQRYVPPVARLWLRSRRSRLSKRSIKVAGRPSGRLA
jgi:hypothetical protein